MDVNVKVAAVGAVSAALADAALEVNFENNPTYWRDRFPYLEPSLVLPPLDDWLVAGLSLFTLFDRTRDFGLGALLYSGPMLAGRTVVRAARVARVTPAARVVVQR